MTRPAVFTLLLLTVAGGVVVAADKECYSCNYDRDLGTTYDARDCVPSPDLIMGPGNTTQCAKKCYTDAKVDTVSNAIIAVTRGCDEDGTKAVGCTTEGRFTTCTTVCDDADGLCNGQNETTTLNEHVMCYSCVYSGGVGNDTCVQHPELHNTIPCYPPRTCYTTAQWTRGGDNRLHSFGRGCADFTLRPKTCEDAQYRDCLSICCSDECNDGNGKTGYADPRCYRQQQTRTPPTATGSSDPSSAPASSPSPHLMLLLGVACSFSGWMVLW